MKKLTQIFLFISLLMLTFTINAYSQQAPKVLDKRGSVAPPTGTGTCQSSSRYTQTGTTPILWICDSAGVWKKSTIENFKTTCEILIGDPASTSPVLTEFNDVPSICNNTSNSSQKIIEVKCYAKGSTGTVVVLPQITSGSSNSILSANLTCGNNTFSSAGTLNGTPTLSSNNTIDANIVSVSEGSDIRYIVIRIIKELI